MSGCDLVGLTRCESGACPAGTRCNTETNYCEAIGIRLVSPTGGTVGPSSQVVAELTFRDPDATEVPSSLQLRAGPQQVQLSRGADGRYTGVWTPQSEGPVTLVVRDGAAGMSSEAVEVMVDLTPPVFIVSAPAPFRTETGGFTDRDGEAWKRDERLPVYVAGGAGIDVSSVQYSVQVNVGGAPGTTTSLRPVPRDGGTSAAYFGTAEVDLAEPQFDGFRGTVVINVTGKDLAGNAGAGTYALPLTRLKWIWRYPFAGTQLEPVITDDGAIWSGVQDGGEGRIFRIEPDGNLSSFNAPGLVGGMLVAHHPADLRQGVYFTANTDGGAYDPDAGTLRVIHSGTRQLSQVCGPYAEGVYPQLALMYGNETTQQFEQAIAFASRADGGTLVGARILPGETLCVARKTALSPAPGTSWGASFWSLYLTQGSSTHRWNLSQSSWNETGGGWPASATFFNGIALNGPDLYGAGKKDSSGGLFVLASDGLSGPRGAAVTGSAVARPGAFDENWMGYFGDGAGAFVQANSAGVVNRVALDAGTAPVLGEDGTVYAIDVNGRLAAFSGALEEKWAVGDAGVQANAMLLDCARQKDGGYAAGRPGTLYIPSGAGMTAVIVDSPGLNSSAGWPRARHDNRNTASADTDLPVCP
ncbi:MAG: hypothetical protein M3Y59_21350 [Myxococcota bacterium]|nr:hypothetical protein [Myxococcota bacterium]